MQLKIEAEVKLDLHRLQNEGLKKDGDAALLWILETKENQHRLKRLANGALLGGGFDNKPFKWAHRNGYDGNIVKSFRFKKVRIIYLIDDKRDTIHVVMLMNRDWNYEANQCVRDRVEGCYDRLEIDRIH